MTAPQMIPLQWNGIQHINEFGNQLSPDDFECLEEVRAILARHGRLNKFGIALLHRHFGLNDDEIFIETIDPLSRSMNIQAMPRAEIDVDIMQETLWRFGPNPGEIRAEQECKISITHNQSNPTPPEPSPTQPSPGSVDPTPSTTPPVDPSPKPPPRP